MKKEIGIIGLGKMGANIARRLSKKGWKVVGFNRTISVTKNLETEGIVGAYTLEEVSQKLSSPRLILMVLPSGKPTEDMLFGKETIVTYLEKGDIVIDGANSFYKDTIKNYERMKNTDIEFVDAGISGGPGGALNGACLMVGGKSEIFKKIEDLFKDMAKNDAVAFFEGEGAGHFVKMVHNGIEYGMMQSIAEGFGIMKKSPYNLDLIEVTNIYNNGSVVESRLVGWLKQAFEKYGDNLEEVSGAVGFNGEGEWTSLTAKDLGVESPVIDESVEFRKKSQGNPSFIGKVLTGMRNSFGGHSIEKGKMT